MRSLLFILMCTFAFTTASAQLSVECVVEAKIGCPGTRVGSFRVDVKGGTPPYQYTWSNPKFKGRKPKGISAGVYTVTVKDSKGRTGSATATMSEPPLFIVVPDMTRILGVSKIGARDGRASVIAQGGTPPYAYEWSNGADTPTVLGLEAGKYTITVTDSYNCRAPGQIEIAEPKQKTIPEIAVETTPEPDPTPVVEPEPEPQPEPQPIVSIQEVKPEATFAVGQVIQVEKLFFKANMADIKEESYPVLDEMYNFLISNKVIVEIGGHTNSIPTDEFCFQLSDARAKTVAEYLYGKGIPESQVSYKGYGKTQPIADNSTYEGRERNQRVEIKILSVE